MSKPIKNQDVLSAIQELFQDAEKIELPEEPQGKAYALDMVNNGKEEKWIYFSEAGIMTIVSDKKVPAYRIKDKNKLNKLLGI